MENKTENKATDLNAIFPKGEKGAAENFTVQLHHSWQQKLSLECDTYL